MVEPPYTCVNKWLDKTLEDLISRDPRLRDPIIFSDLKVHHELELPFGADVNHLAEELKDRLLATHGFAYHDSPFGGRYASDQNLPYLVYLDTKTHRIRLHATEDQTIKNILITIRGLLRKINSPSNYGQTA